MRTKKAKAADKNAERKQPLLFKQEKLQQRHSYPQRQWHSSVENEANDSHMPARAHSLNYSQVKYFSTSDYTKSSILL
jgi:hypothetical protein